jgi:hypothetical protein
MRLSSWTSPRRDGSKQQQPFPVIIVIVNGTTVILPYALLALRALHATIMPLAHQSACVPLVQRFASLMAQITYTLTSLIVRDTAPMLFKTLVSYAYYVTRVMCPLL